MTSNIRPSFDQEIVDIAHYVHNYAIQSTKAYDTARLCLMDSLGCAMLALCYPECTKLLGPMVPGATLTGGARVPGTVFELDPVQAAFNIGAMIRWLDYNDTWLAQEWGHPSDNLGGILAVADYLNRVQGEFSGSIFRSMGHPCPTLNNPCTRVTQSRSTEFFSQAKPLTMRDVLTAMIKAYEIQGILALENSFNRVGIDHVVLVKIATTAVVSYWLGLDETQTCDALSQAFVDGQSLRTYRHAPNTGSRKSWAAGDATARGVLLALLTLRGERGYPSALSAKKWGLYDVMFNGKPFEFQRAYGSYVMEHILFKISYPAEFHAQTAVECALLLHPKIKHRLNDIEKITIRTQEPAMRILNKTGPLYNPADRDHSLQYMIAIGLIYGVLTADHYEDRIAGDSRIDALREKMQVVEEGQFSRDYLDPEKRAIGNAVQVFFKDGTATEEICVAYPVGHHRRRAEGVALLEKKFRDNVSTRFSPEKTEQLFGLFQDVERLEKMPVSEFMGFWK